MLRPGGALRQPELKHKREGDVPLSDCTTRQIVYRGADERTESEVA
jgi:hypothetical protein